MNKKYDSEFAFKYHRKSTRLKTHNYGWSGTYFITICTEEDEPVLEIPALRAILEQTWQALPARFAGLELGEFVIMPDHIHFIIKLEGKIEKPATLGNVVGAYKSLTTVGWLNHIKDNGLECRGVIWQRGFDQIPARTASFRG
jgi:REP element-mobilizing transposase RayT